MSLREEIYGSSYSCRVSEGPAGQFLCGSFQSSCCPADAEPSAGVLLLRVQVEPLPQSHGGSVGSQAVVCTSDFLPDGLGETNNLALAACQVMCAHLPLFSSPSCPRSQWNFGSRRAAGSLLAITSSSMGSSCFPESTDCSLLPDSVA